jgi:hypothetical protein
MKNLAVIILITMSACSVQGQHIHSFKWLTGTWHVKAGAGLIVERWKFVNDSTYRGESFFVKQKDTVSQEVIELSKRKGFWYYIPTVKGQNNNQPVLFKVLFASDSEFIAENREHDFPQRIAYRRVGNNLYASIEGVKKGKYGKQNYDYETGGH